MIIELIDASVEKGWQPYEGIDSKYLRASALPSRVTFDYIDERGLSHPLDEWSIVGVLFDHGFAKALFGEEIIIPNEDVAWGWYLKQAVVSQNPLEHMYMQVIGMKKHVVV
jgi:hypothetical protein